MRKVEVGAGRRWKTQWTGWPMLTTILGLLPVMFGTEIGTEVMKRIASPMVGGLVTSTINTLIVIPAIYAMAYRWRYRRELEDTGWLDGNAAGGPHGIPAPVKSQLTQQTDR